MRKGDHLSNQLVIILMLDIYFELDSIVGLEPKMWGSSPIKKMDSNKTAILTAGR